MGGIRSGALLVAGVVAGLVVLAVVVLWGLSSPVIDDDCVSGYARCRAAAEGVSGAVDCRLEMLHCRAWGPEHWSEVLPPAGR